MRQLAREAVNRVLHLVGARAVSETWGPRGFVDALRRAKGAGATVTEVVDAGAARGEWTRECMEVFPQARYFLVDPLMENQAILARLAAERRGVTVWIGALGAHEETRPYFVHGDQSSFYPSEFAHTSACSVKVRPLDSFLGHEISGPSLIKADVQGHELDVLAGGTRCLESAELVLLEVSFRRVYARAPLAHDVIAVMGSRGFRIFDLCSYAQRPRDGELSHADILFARDGSRVFAEETYL